MLIMQLSKRSSVSVSTIRRLERQGILQPIRDIHNWRIFTQADLDVLKARYRRSTNERVDG
jgi:DNA-binding transcriptional MerR regulator